MQPSPAVDFHIVLRGLAKAYRRGGRDQYVLNALDVEIARGEFLVLFGRSGSGKSTLLNLIGALDVPTAGTVIVDGKNLFDMNERARSLWRRRAVGIVFQAYNLIPTLSAGENLRLPLELHGYDRRVAAAAAAEQLERVGLAGYADAFPDELSGGEQQRVAVARAIVHRPELVLADEPTGNLDSETGRRVLRLLEDLCRERGTTLVMATHDRDVVEIADRVLTVRDGCLRDPTE